MKIYVVETYDCGDYGQTEFHMGTNAFDSKFKAISFARYEASRMCKHYANASFLEAILEYDLTTVTVFKQCKMCPMSMAQRKYVIYSAEVK